MSINQEAHETVCKHNYNYGDSFENFSRIAKFASHLTGKELTPSDCVKVMMAVKLSREAFQHKPDNLVDLCGYAEILNKLENFDENESSDE